MTIQTVKEIICNDTPYLDAVTEEVSRHPATSVEIIRKAMVDTQVLGFHIPAGTDIFLMNSGPGTLMKAFEADESKRSKSSQDAKNRCGAWDPANIATFHAERWLVKDASGQDKFNP